MLGVERTAGYDEIKRAYVERARRYHPDRHTDASDATRQAAERRMREVNAAWAVLRNPARRAAYDASLRGERPVWERSSPGGSPRPPRTTVVRPGAGAPSPPGFEVPAAHAPFLRFGPIVLIGLVLLGVLIFTAYANQQQNVAPGTTTPVDGGAPSAAVVPFSVGDCVFIASVGGRLLPVATPSCTSPGAQQVLAITDLGRPCSAGQSFDLQAEKVRLCLGS